MEGSRISASVGLYRDVETAADIQDGDSKVHLHKGQRIMVDCVCPSPLTFAATTANISTLGYCITRQRRFPQPRDRGSDPPA